MKYWNITSNILRNSLLLWVWALVGCSPWGTISKIFSLDASQIVAPISPVIPIVPTDAGPPWDGKLTVVGTTESSAANYKYSLYKVSTGVALNPLFNTKPFPHQMATASYSGDEYLFMMNNSLGYNSTTNYSYHLQYVNMNNVSTTASIPIDIYSGGSFSDNAIPTYSPVQYGADLHHWTLGQCSYFIVNDKLWTFDLGNTAAGAQDLGISIAPTWGGSSAFNQVLAHNGKIYVRNTTTSSIDKIEPSIGCTQKSPLTGLTSAISVPFLFNNKVYFFSTDYSTNRMYDEDGNFSSIPFLIWMDQSGQNLAAPTSFIDQSHLYATNTTHAFLLNGSDIISIDVANNAYAQYSDPNGVLISFWGIYNVGNKIVVGAYDTSGSRNLYYLDTANPANPFVYLDTIETFSTDPVFATYNLQNPVQLSTKLYYTASGATGTELYKIDGSTATPTASLVTDLISGANSGNPRMLQIHNGVMYFLADKANGQSALYKMSAAESFTELPNINATNFLLHNFTVLSQLPSDNTDDLERFVFSFVDIAGETYINIHGNRSIEINMVENTTVSGQSFGAFNNPTPIIVPYAMGISLGGANYTRGDSIPVGKYQDKDILKLFSHKGYQFYSYDGSQLVQLTDLPGGVGQLTDYLSVMVGSKIIFSTLRNSSRHGYLSTSALYSLDLTNSQVTEITLSGNSISYAANFRTTTATDGKEYLYAMTLPPGASSTIIRVDDTGQAVEVQTPDISLYNNDWNTFGMVEAYGQLFFVSKDQANMIEHYDSNQNLIMSPQAELDLWRIDMNDPSPNPQATKVLDNLVAALDVTKETSYNSDVFLKGYDDMYLLSFTATGMIGRKMKNIQIGSQKYLTIPNADSNDMLYENLIYINSQNNLEVVATNSTNIIQLTDSLVIAKTDGSYWEVKNGVATNLNLNLAPASNGSNGTYRIYAGFVGYGNKLYTSVVEATIDPQTQQPASLDMKLREITLSSNGNHTTRDITSLISGTFNPSFPSSQLVSMNFSLSSSFGKSLNIAGTKIYTAKTILPAQSTDMPRYEVVTYDIATDSIASAAIPNISTTDTSGANVTLVPVSIGFFDYKNVASLKKRGAFVNGTPANGAFIYAAYMRSDGLTGGIFSMSPVLYFFNGSSLEKLYQWNVTQDQVLGFVLNPSCFIATAAYGSMLDNRIDSLRAFRDQFLMKFELGQKFINYYYTNAPPIAQYVAQHAWARNTVRMVLWPIVGFSALSVECGLMTAISVYMLMLFGIAFGLRFILRRKPALNSTTQ